MNLTNGMARLVTAIYLLLVGAAGLVLVVMAFDPLMEGGRVAFAAMALIAPILLMLDNKESIGDAFKERPVHQSIATTWLAVVSCVFAVGFPYSPFPIQAEVVMLYAAVVGGPMLLWFIVEIIALWIYRGFKR